MKTAADLRPIFPQIVEYVSERDHAVGRNGMALTNNLEFKVGEWLIRVEYDCTSTGYDCFNDDYHCNEYVSDDAHGWVTDIEAIHDDGTELDIDELVELSDMIDYELSEIIDN